MDNLLTDVRDFVTDRFGSPFWVSTLVSWLLVNWKITTTVIFNSELINIQFLQQYFDETHIFYIAILPPIMGLSYSILSGSLKESVEILAKAVRSQLIRLDLSGKLYKSIPIEEHNKKINRFKRQLDKINSEKTDTEEVLNQNDELNRIIEEIDQRDIKLIELMRTEVFGDNLDNQIKKMRLLKKMHELNFGRILSEDDIPDDSPNHNDKENLEIAAEEISENSTSIDFEKAFSNNFKSKEKYPNDRIVSNTIGKALRTYEHEDLKDPYSHKTLLLTLLLVKGRLNSSDRLDPTLLGLDPSVLNKSVQSAVTSGLIKKGNSGVTLSPEGAEKISELLSYLSDQPVVRVLEDYYEKTKKDITDILQSRALSSAQVIGSIRYHPNTQEAINELLKNKTIVKQGNLLFPKSIAVDSGKQ